MSYGSSVVLPPSLARGRNADPQMYKKMLPNVLGASNRSMGSLPRVPSSPSGRMETLPSTMLPSQRLGQSASQPQLRRGGELTSMVAQREHSPDSDGADDDAAHFASQDVQAKRRAVMEILANPDLEPITKKIFSTHDQDHNGLLSSHDLDLVLDELETDLGLAQGHDFDAAVRLFKRHDVDDSGMLDFKEFFELFQELLRLRTFDAKAALGRECFVTKNQGNVWDKFTKLKELGSGSFGTAYLAKLKSTGEERVVKAVKKSRVKLPVEDVEKEIIIMRQVDHPHIIRLRRWYEDRKRIYLVLDALKGGTLQQVILETASQKQKGLKESWIRTIMEQCIQAMGYVHSLRLIHKDLKDENIMLLKKDESYDKPFAVIIDLGLAEMFTSKDPMGKEMGGTPATMAPEVWQGTFGPKCDVWSLGVVLFEMISGRMPFTLNSLDPQAWVRLHKRGPDWTLVKTSPAGKGLCQHMLCFAEHKRPTMAQCVAHDWFRTERHQLRSIAPANFSSLQSVVNSTALKRGVLLEVASSLPMEDAGRVVDIFKGFDTDGDGRVSLQELKVAFKELGLTDGGLAEKTFAVMDVDSDGFLSFTEFSSMVLMLFKDILEDRLTKMMREHDTDDDQNMNQNEVHDFLSHVSELIDREPGSNKRRSVDALREIKGHTKISYRQLRDKLLSSGTAAPGRGRMTPSDNLSVTGSSVRGSSTPMGQSRPRGGQVRRSVQLRP